MKTDLDMQEIIYLKKKSKLYLTENFGMLCTKMLTIDILWVEGLEMIFTSLLSFELLFAFEIKYELLLFLKIKLILFLEDIH